MKKDLLYSVTCLAFAVIIGGAIYEHLNIVPRWAAAPPASLSMFQGPHALKLDLFWKIIHPVNLVLFVFTLITHWKSARRQNIAWVLASYVLILVITTIYFVPELISITTSGFSSVPDAELTNRASLWELLSIVRLSTLVVLSVILLTGLTKSNRQLVTARS